MPRVAFGGIQELPSNEAREEERVDRKGDNLGQGDAREGSVLAAHRNYAKWAGGGEKATCMGCGAITRSIMYL